MQQKRRRRVGQEHARNCGVKLAAAAVGKTTSLWHSAAAADQNRSLYPL